MDVRLIESFFFAFAIPGAFPLWLAWRRGRPLLGVAALAACVAIGWAVVVFAEPLRYQLFASVFAGAVGGLLCAIGCSLLLLRVAR